jgi:prepilin-type N-terminal cleavage/methylation domain-containing protein
MRRRERKGFTLLEIVPVLTIVAFLATIVILSLNPKKQFLEARNSARKNDIAHIADAIAEYSRDKSTDLLMSIPTGSAQELCADLLTGSCSLMVNIRSRKTPIVLMNTPATLSSDGETASPFPHPIQNLQARKISR